MGQGSQPALEAMGVKCFRAETPEEVAEITEAALSMVFQSGISIAVLLTQRLIGAKAFG